VRIRGTLQGCSLAICSSYDASYPLRKTLNRRRAHQKPCSLYYNSSSDVNKRRPMLGRCSFCSECRFRMIQGVRDRVDVDREIEPSAYSRTHTAVLGQGRS
jgi:hypothetical protein